MDNLKDIAIKDLKAIVATDMKTFASMEDMSRNKFLKKILEDYHEKNKHRLPNKQTDDKANKNLDQREEIPDSRGTLRGNVEETEMAAKPIYEQEKRA